MNIGQIKAVASAYLQTTQLEKFAAGSVDLLTVAANNAKRRAEQIHDWNCERRSLTMTVNPTGLLSSALDGSCPVRVKQVNTFYLQTTISGQVCKMPLRHSDLRRQAIMVQEYQDRITEDGLDLGGRYLGDRYSSDLGNKIVEVYLQNDTVYLDPEPSYTTTLELDAYVWLDEYVNDSDEDWFTLNGAEYLQWAVILEGNKLIQTFVPQQEGSISESPLERAKEEALAALIEFDNFYVEAGREVRKR